jgi:protein TonB
MFTNLIESDSHRHEFKRRSLFFFATTAAYALFLFAAGIASIYAYDARLESQSADMTVLSWIPPVTLETASRPHETPSVRRQLPSTAPIDRHVTVPERINPVSTTDDPTRIPKDIGTMGPEFPPVKGAVKIGTQNLDPPTMGASGGCATCSGTGPVVVKETTPPPAPIPVKSPTQRLASTVLASKAISLPQPQYPQLAKQIHVEGTVAVQILVGENGKVISAQAVSGHPMLTRAAADAALRALFTPTLLNGQPVKVQGVITYNFVLR